jgi:hypothetical protein
MTTLYRDDNLKCRNLSKIFRKLLHFISRGVLCDCRLNFGVNEMIAFGWCHSGMRPELNALGTASAPTLHQEASYSFCKSLITAFEYEHSCGDEGRQLRPMTGSAGLNGVFSASSLILAPACVRIYISEGSLASASS